MNIKLFLTLLFIHYYTFNFAQESRRDIKQKQSEQVLAYKADKLHITLLNSSYLPSSAERMKKQDEKRRAEKRLEVLNQCSTLSIKEHKIKFSDSDLEEIPDEIIALEKLDTLVFTNHRLKQFPSDLKSIENIRYLNLSQNDFSNKRINIKKFKNLEYLDLSDCGISQLPKGLKKLKKLKVLRIGNNPLMNTKRIQKCKSLESLNLDGSSRVL
ncbi:hypothetical protein MY04_1796 [Flammeovirga sp. MY04]|uniref:leucine-rich repeat domain-containing protein n=1 Tax=Flammeovirga sp. MY04 TaxID=1191459 RepID=UPI00080630F2|nr:leucine-rich repeat domain-containing protein [Flammeovirga sp. MY04]ANQ49170.1 hypothetical protein MY04_1796 [Flammeovirga sp. MY04]